MIPFYNPDIIYYSLANPHPIQPILYPIFFPDHPTTITSNQYGNNIEQHQERNQLSQLRRENEAISRENHQLRASDVSQGLRVKRKYRKRRLWLQKKFRCNYKDCNKKYASKIALNSHKRKKHSSQVRKGK